MAECTGTSIFTGNALISLSMFYALAHVYAVLEEFGELLKNSVAKAKCPHDFQQVLKLQREAVTQPYSQLCVLFLAFLALFLGNSMLLVLLPAV